MITNVYSVIPSESSADKSGEKTEGDSRILGETGERFVKCISEAIAAIPWAQWVDGWVERSQYHMPLSELNLPCHEDRVQSGRERGWPERLNRPLHRKE